MSINLFEYLFITAQLLWVLTVTLISLVTFLFQFNGFQTSTKSQHSHQAINNYYLLTLSIEK